MDPITLALLAAGGSGLLTAFLNPGKGYEKGQGQLDKYYGQSQGYLEPYMNRGNEAGGDLSSAYKALLNPAELQNEWAQGYQTSPYAQDLMGMANQQGLNSASSQGLLGSTPGLQAIQAGTSQIANADRQKYMDDLFQKYIQGAQLAQGIYGTGAQAGSQMGQNAMNMGQNSAQMAYGKQNAPGEMFSNLFGTAMGFGGNYMKAQGMNNMANAWKTGG